ncbi:aldo-keto reductase AKR2E4 [Nasonia vitripennis]|uniref:NADP-dependent oxidoreductase domain-containing protein n=1 Tax=Nasonia vitripennis TaxID=7425 RepID=A0A7M7G667_NASVI|nr:aldo-keto reductase AKR2E4 [Nasonia vitripennis]
MTVPTIFMNNGYTMPSFGFGTYSLKGKEGEKVIKHAIELGYRLIDTALLYDNEKTVGNAVREKIKDGTVKRENLFITTKLGNKFHRADQVVFSCEQSLQNLGLDYVDLFLMHSPISLEETDDPTKIVPSNIDYVETWKGMEECKKRGLARTIGISNFNSEQIARLMSAATIKPVNNQVEVNLNLPQKPMTEFCKKHNISVTGYSPLGKPGKRPHIKNLWLDPIVLELSQKYAKTPAQISLRFVVQMGVIPIPMSDKLSHIKENLEIFDFSLTDEEMSRLQNIGTGARVVPLDKYKDAKYYPFNIPF